jgi:hypothetical protein
MLEDATVQNTVVVGRSMSGARPLEAGKTDVQTMFIFLLNLS